MLARESGGKGIHLLGVSKTVLILKRECNLRKKESISGQIPCVTVESLLSYYPSHAHD